MEGKEKRRARPRPERIPREWYFDETPEIAARELTFRSGDAVLSGTAYVPAEGDSLPGIVALHGASEPLRSSAAYEHLRVELPRLGFSVLLFDRRGTGESTGDPDAGYAALADDGVAGKKALGRLPRVDPQRIGFWGLSQGGWIALLAASRSESPVFAISVSAPLGPVAKQMEFATSNLLQIRGFSRQDVRELRHARRTWLDYLRGETSLGKAAKAVRQVERKPWFPLAFIPRARELQASQGALKELDFDVTSTVGRIRAPMLFIYGGRDPWVPVKDSVMRLRALAAESGNISYAVIPRASHMMMLKEEEKMEFDPKTLNTEGPEAHGYFALIGSWLSRQVKS